MNNAPPPYAAWLVPSQWAIRWACHVLLIFAVLLSVPAWAQSSAAASTPAQKTVLVMGDSLSAAHNLATAEGWVALTANRIARTHPQWKVINASISGETTAGGASRIGDELTRHRPSVVVIELGANDGLRGLPLAQSRANLERMIRASKQAGAKVLLIGMRMPPNLGRAYTETFQRNYADLAEEHDAALLPFLLEPIALDRDAFQDDNLHPVAEAQPKILDHVWPVLEPLLD